jgi:hypothetical protein
MAKIFENYYFILILNKGVLGSIGRLCGICSTLDKKITISPGISVKQAKSTILKVRNMMSKLFLNLFLIKKFLGPIRGVLQSLIHFG